MHWIEEKIKEGKAKMGVCELDDCAVLNEELLFRVKDKYVCGKCLDEIGEKMKKLGML